MPDAVTVTLTKEQLTDIRVSVLCRLEMLQQGIQKPKNIGHKERCEKTYSRIRSMMDDNGVLLNALRAFRSIGPEDGL